MAHLLNAEAVTTTVAGRVLLDAVSLGLDDGDRVGVVGRNGDGKSTLLRLLARRQEPDAGRVAHAGDLRISVLDQHDALDPGVSVRQAVVGSVPPHEWASDARTRDVVTGLLGGLDALDETPVASLSGGQRRRVALAGLLARPGDDRLEDLLMLDEPTNHLDVEGVDWLARHLRGRWAAGRGGLVVVTHDRWFLDAVCERTWEVHDGVVDAYEGGYAAYVLARAERGRRAAVAEERRRNLLRKELAWLQRGAPARTTKPRFRLDAAAALVADEPPPRDSLALERLATARLGKDVVDLEDVVVERAGRRVLDGVTWRLAPGQRVGVVGANGSGKTTLLRLLEGTLQPDAGRVRRGKTVRVAMLSQEVRELDEVAGSRVVEAVEEVRGAVAVAGRELTAGQLVERLGFTRARAWTRVADLSGGERRRLQLLRLLVGEPNVLLLDEPTNDLDTDVLTAVEDLLDGWPGTLVVVSHDRYLLERTTDSQVAVMGDGRLLGLPGGVEQYLALRQPALPAAESARPQAPPSGSADATGPSAGAQRAARKEMARVERRLGRIVEEEAAVHAEMAARATDHEVVMALDGRLRALAEERAELEEAWLTAGEVAEG